MPVAELCADTPAPATKPEGIPPGSIMEMAAFMTVEAAPNLDLEFLVHLRPVPGGFIFKGRRKEWSEVCPSIESAISAETALWLADLPQPTP